VAEVPVIADVDADARVGRVERRIAQIARLEIELLPESRRHVRDVVLAVFAKVFAVGVNHRRRVVIDAGDLFLVDRNDQYHPMFARDILHQFHCPPVGDLFDRFVPSRLLFGAEIRRGEDLLHAQNLHTLFGRRFDHAEMFLDVDPLDLFDRRVSWRGVLRLNQTAFDCALHNLCSSLHCFRF
jgi:hypothetical protein